VIETPLAGWWNGVVEPSGPGGFLAREIEFAFFAGDEALDI